MEREALIEVDRTRAGRVSGRGQRRQQSERERGAFHPAMVAHAPPAVPGLQALAPRSEIAQDRGAIMEVTPA